MNNFRCSFVAGRCTLHLLSALQLATNEVSSSGLPMKTRLVRRKTSATNALQKHTLRCRSNRFRSSPLPLLLQPLGSLLRIALESLLIARWPVGFRFLNAELFGTILVSRCTLSLSNEV